MFSSPNIELFEPCTEPNPSNGVGSGNNWSLFGCKSSFHHLDHSGRKIRRPLGRAWNRGQGTWERLLKWTAWIRLQSSTTRDEEAGASETNRATSVQRLSMTFKANGKRQTVGSCVSQKHDNLRFSTCLTLSKSYSVYLGNRQERSLSKSSFFLFWRKENFILPFAVKVMLNLSNLLRVFRDMLTSKFASEAMSKNRYDCKSRQRIRLTREHVARQTRRQIFWKDRWTHWLEINFA